MNRNPSPPVRHFEEYPEGAVFELGSIQVEPDELLSFARRFDPQPFHTDARAAAESPYGGLIASGWHPSSLTMRLLATKFLSPSSISGTPGIDQLRWPAPVPPVEQLRVRCTLLSSPPSPSHPSRVRG